METQLCSPIFGFTMQFTDDWQWEADAFTKLDFGKWEIVIPPRADGSCAINHKSEIKIIVRTHSGQLVSRLSPWAKYVWQPPKELNQGTNYKQLVWNPPPHDVSRAANIYYSDYVHGRTTIYYYFVNFFSISISSIANQPNQNHYESMNVMLASPL